MCKYYNDMNFMNKSCIYTSLFNDYYRHIITRWRLSNHNLAIETGRYKRPVIERENRICASCNVIEDEYHAVFRCPLYGIERRKYRHLMSCSSISEFLNPVYENVKNTAQFLHEIEELRK